MDGTAQVLIAVDDSREAEIVAIEAVRLLGDNPGRCWALYHVMFPHGVTDGAVPVLHPALHAHRQQVREFSMLHGRSMEELHARDAARRVWRELRILGVPDHRISSSVHWPETGETLEGALHDAADDRGCDVIAVGRHAFPWYRRVFHHHTAEDLLDLPAKHHAVLVVPLRQEWATDGEAEVRPAYADPESGPAVARLLFLADDSHAGPRQFRLVCDLAERHGAEVLLAHVETGLEGPLQEGSFPFVTAGHPPVQRLRALRAIAAERQVPAREVGSVSFDRAHALTELAVREHADLVVAPYGSAAAGALVRAVAVPLLILPAPRPMHA